MSETKKLQKYIHGMKKKIAHLFKNIFESSHSLKEKCPTFSSKPFVSKLSNCNQLINIYSCYYNHIFSHIIKENTQLNDLDRNIKCLVSYNN